MAILEIRKCMKMAKLIHIKAEQCQKYTLYRKMIQVKVFEHSISHEKIEVRICLSPARGELGGCKDNHF